MIVGHKIILQGFGAQSAIITTSWQIRLPFHHTFLNQLFVFLPWPPFFLLPAEWKKSVPLRQALDTGWIAYIFSPDLISSVWPVMTQVPSVRLNSYLIYHILFSSFIAALCGQFQLTFFTVFGFSNSLGRTDGSRLWWSSTCKSDKWTTSECTGSKRP